MMKYTILSLPLLIAIADASMRFIQVHTEDQITAMANDECSPNIGEAILQLMQEAAQDSVKDEPSLANHLTDFRLMWQEGDMDAAVTAYSDAAAAAAAEEPEPAVRYLRATDKADENHRRLEFDPCHGPGGCNTSDPDFTRAECCAYFPQCQTCGAGGGNPNNRRNLVDNIFVEEVSWFDGEIALASWQHSIAAQITMQFNQHCSIESIEAACWGCTDDGAFGGQIRTAITIEDSEVDATR